MLDRKTADVNSPTTRCAGSDLLSLALMDARNRTLRWAALYETLVPSDGVAQPVAGLGPLSWMLGHIGWFQEYWIARNVQRQRGTVCDPRSPRLASIEPNADRWYDPAQSTLGERWHLDLPEWPSIRQYLADTIDITLELLEAADGSDAGLYFFRLALFHEDMQAEALAEMAQTRQLALGEAAGLLDEITASFSREPLQFPAVRWSLGSAEGGFVFDNEKWAHDVHVPPFQIDAHPITWAQYDEFVEDGGYDEPSWWSDGGRAWLDREGRRVPRHVDQMRHGVLQRRWGRLTRVPPAQPVMHVSWYEADAWCRWAGRRLPTEVEWEVAAHAPSRGFAWGSVWEWTAGTFRPYPGFTPDPWAGYSVPAFGREKVLRGASFATVRRLRHAKFRRFAEPARDDLFCGFRSCAP